ncbi:hypothetical protein [Dyadobacter diqingensis]|uniref:hypothetical protein n=1 Tax=Dyadobacter diqingensis TaxID=2938121 RepID=UPI0020C55885|nr:hypothetical protein [Dyadobacter diqingensis]
MEKLTQEDIRKISLYIPFRVRFGAMLNPQGMWERFYPAGQIGSTIIQSYDKKWNSVENCSDISNSKNDDRPILYKLEDMTDDQLKEIEKRFDIQSGFFNKDSMVQLMQRVVSLDVFLYALSEHLDLFGLISAGKAIDGNTLR